MLYFTGAYVSAPDGYIHRWFQQSCFGILYVNSSWALDMMMAFANVFSWKKSFAFWFNKSLFLRIQPTNMLVWAQEMGWHQQVTSHYLKKNDDIFHWRISELSSYPGYFQEPHWFSMGLLEISRVTLIGMACIFCGKYTLSHGNVYTLLQLTDCLIDGCRTHHNASEC